MYESTRKAWTALWKSWATKVELFPPCTPTGSPTSAYTVTTDLINSGTEFDCIFANNGMMAQGCYNALKDAGKENIPIVSTGGSPDDFQMLQDGVEAACMTAPVSIQGVKTFLNLYNKVALGEDPAEKFTALPVIPVTADDTSAYIAWDDYAAAYEYLQAN
ncbi:MAG: sugar ABC transporter substrate-binding protein [Ruthenibacterium sp.]